VDFRWEGERIRRKSPIDTKRGAEEYERKLRLELVAGAAARQEGQSERREIPTLSEFAKEFISTYAKANNKPSEVQAKEIILRRHLVPVFGKLRLDQIDARGIERYKAAKLTGTATEKPLMAKSINNHLAVLQKMFALAVEWQLLGQAPPVKWLKAPAPEFDFLTFEEAERLIAAADEEWRPMIVVGLRAGLRQGELLALRWEDVDLIAGRLMVRQAVARGVVGTPKSGKGREVPLSKGAVQALKAHRHLRGELVFCDQDGKMLAPSVCVWPLWRACKRAGIRRVRWHVLRHTFASHLAMRGVPLKVGAGAARPRDDGHDDALCAPRARRPSAGGGQPGPARGGKWAPNGHQGRGQLANSRSCFGKVGADVGN
jgi:integrase